MAKLKEKILEIIKSACAISEDNINEETNLSELSLDSLSFIIMLINIEDDFNIEFDDEELNIEKFNYVSDIIKLVEDKTNEKVDKG